MHVHFQTTLPRPSKQSKNQRHSQSAIYTHNPALALDAGKPITMAFVAPYGHHDGRTINTEACANAMIVNSGDNLAAHAIPTSHPHIHPHSQAYSHAHVHSHGRPRSLSSTQSSGYHFTHAVSTEPTTVSFEGRQVVPSLPLSHFRPMHPILASTHGCNPIIYDHPLLPGIYPLSPLACAFRRAPSPFIGSLTREEFIKICTLYLDNGIRINENNINHSDSILPSHTQPESVFFSVSKPDICTEEYVRRLVHYAHCSPSAFVVMLIYLDRAAQSNQRLKITALNLHRLLVTALMLACKFLDDHCFSNMHYAKVGGIPNVKEMNRLEFQFLRFLDFRLCVDKDLFFAKQDNLNNFVIAPVP